MPVILGIETSCDETSAAVCIDGKIFSNTVFSQSIHGKYGGIVPEIASRLHQQRIVPAILRAMHDAKINKNDLSAVAFTRGPGLIGSLLVGVSFAKAFAMARNIPIVAVNHLHAHIMAHFIEKPEPEFPFLSLIISGGHTILSIVKDHYTVEVLGETLDDAAGEAFDKSAKILGFPYPGGPLIDENARDGDIHYHKFPGNNVPGYDFSFSGLKTSFLYFVRDRMNSNPDFVRENLSHICASIQHAIVESLLIKVEKALDTFALNQIAVSGGVAANSYLRKVLYEKAKVRNRKVWFPSTEYCTDNAAMISLTGYYKYLRKDFCPQSVVPLARYPL